MSPRSRPNRLLPALVRRQPGQSSLGQSSGWMTAPEQLRATEVGSSKDPCEGLLTVLRQRRLDGESTRLETLRLTGIIVGAGHRIRRGFP